MGYYSGDLGACPHSMPHHLTNFDLQVFRIMLTTIYKVVNIYNSKGKYG